MAKKEAEDELQERNQRKIELHKQRDNTMALAYAKKRYIQPPVEKKPKKKPKVQPVSKARTLFAFFKKAKKS